MNALSDLTPQEQETLKVMYNSVLKEPSAVMWGVFASTLYNYGLQHTEAYLSARLAEQALNS